jgi:hypothetical protein
VHIKSKKGNNTMKQKRDLKHIVYTMKTIGIRENKEN